MASRGGSAGFHVREREEIVQEEGMASRERRKRRGGLGWFGCGPKQEEERGLSPLAKSKQVGLLFMMERESGSA